MSQECDEADAILDRIAIEQKLAELSPMDRAMVELLYMYRGADGYAEWWPPTVEDVGRYLGTTFPELRGKAVSGRTMRRWRFAVEAKWQRELAQPVVRRAR